MPRRIIRSDETQTDPATLVNTDVLAIYAGGSLLTPNAAAVTFAGPTGSLNNLGTILRSGGGPAIVGSLSGVLDIVVANRAGATIEGGTRAIQFTSGDATTGAVRVVNAGTIDGNANNAVDFDSLTASSIAIINQAGGLVTNSGSNDVVRPGNDLTSAITVDNAGTIQADDVAGASENDDGVDLQSQAGGVAARIFNRATGLIEGGKHGVTGGNAATIVNEAGGEIIGRNGSGLNFDTDVTDGDGVVRIINAGLISGRYDGVATGDGDGVDVDYLVRIRNSGTIEGLGADGTDNFADGVAAGGGLIANGGSGTIHGKTNGILIDDGNRQGAFAATQIVNGGTISADDGFAIRLIGTFDDRIINANRIFSLALTAIDMGDGNDGLENSVGGVILGHVFLGAGDDKYFNRGEVSGLVAGGDGNDTMRGGEGVDRIAGDAGADMLTGGRGADTFVYLSAADSVAAAYDIITDFRRGDQIDLSAIDANTTTPDDDTFLFIGEAAFSGAPGEVRIVRLGGSTLVEAEIDGVLGATPDLVILLFGEPAFAPGGEQFVL